jgi:hypothetical protein
VSGAAQRACRARRAAAVVALALASFAVQSRAQPPPPGIAPRVPPASDLESPRPEARGPRPSERLILLFSAPPAEPLAGRLEAELVAAGLVPRRVAIPPAPPFGDLVGLAAEARAQGAIRVEADASGAEVWITDETTGRARLRQSLSAEASPGIVPVIALRTVEFLRASLLPAEAPPAPSARPAAVFAPAEPPAPFAASRWPVRGWLAPAWIASPGGLDGALSGAGGASLRLGAHLGLEALALVPVSAARVAAPEGETRVEAYLAGAGLQLRTSTGRVTADLGAGALAALVRATGTPTGAFVGATDSMGGVAPYVRGGLALGLTPWLALRADVLLGMLAPQATVGVVGNDLVTRDAASWGRPFGALLLGLQGGGS